jgi:hypothetical protein
MGRAGRIPAQTQQKHPFQNGAAKFLNMVVLRLFVLRYTHRPEGELLEN